MNKSFSCLVVLLLASIACVAQVKTPPTPIVKVPFSESLQTVVVTTADWTATTGKARIFERSSKTAEWKAVDDEFPVVVGRSGLAWDPAAAVSDVGTEAVKKEGDGKAPAGFFPLTVAFGSSAKPEQLSFPYYKLESSTECVDDINSAHYNKLVDRFKVGNFDWKSSEKMFEVGPEYELGVFVAYNTYPIKAGDGSCIFLHVWKDANTPTSGCTAMDRLKLESIVSRLAPEKNPYLVQLPEKIYSDRRRSWKLPKLK